jgi:uncharacterized protein (TIGR03663 family)
MNEIVVSGDKEKDSRDTLMPPTTAVDYSIERDSVIFEKIISTAVFVLAVGAAFWFRFYDIGIKPFHHDEGVNSFFLLNLAKTGEYRYDPTNFHGPTLYYLTLIPLHIFGKTDLALRFWPAMFGALCVAMLWIMRRQLGTIGTPVAALCMAASPGLVFFSRDFIHEMSFGCFSLGIVISVWGYIETKRFIWLFILSLSAGMLFATKETAVVNAAALIAAALCAIVWHVKRRRIGGDPTSMAEMIRELKNKMTSGLPSLDHLLSALIIFVFIYVFFYSSLFTHWSGPIDFFRSIYHWTGERSINDHVHPFYYYLGILLKLELPMLIGAVLGGLFVLRQKNIFWLFIAAWTLGMALAYSIIPYKTPWLMISFLIPMAIISGYAAEQLYQLLPPISLRLLWLAVIIIALTACWRLTWRVNFINYDDNNNTNGYFTSLGRSLGLIPYTDGQYGYVYAQTERDIFNLVEELNVQADKLRSRNQTGIYMAAPSSDYWPLPWYLRDYTNIDYIGSLNVTPGQRLSIPQTIIIANANQRDILEGLPGWRAGARTYALRPGVNLVIYVRDENQR